MNIWKSYIWTAGRDVNMKAIFAAMNTTWAVVKIRPEKKFRPVLIKPSSFHPFCQRSNSTSISESKWSRWSSWSDCTKTCGTGSRYRNRTCVAINKGAVFTLISCAGKSSQTVSCAEWNCPGRHVLLACSLGIYYDIIFPEMIACHSKMLSRMSDWFPLNLDSVDFLMNFF